MNDAYSDHPAPGDDPTPKRSSLGSLSQAARGKHLNSARGILLAIGVLTILVNGALFTFAREAAKRDIDQQVQQQGGRGNFDPVTLQRAEDEAVLFASLVYGAAAALGAVFVVLGLIVNRFPVPATVLALVLYIGAGIGFGVLSPETIAQGLIVKIFIVFGLVKAVQAAVAYERERGRVQPEEDTARPARRAAEGLTEYRVQPGSGLVGQTVVARPAPPIVPAVAAAVTALLLALSLATGTAHWAVAAAWPAALAAVVWRAGSRPFRAELTDSALRIDTPPLTIPYDEIEGLQAPRPANPYKAGPRRYRLRVVYPGGAAVLPARLSVSSDDLYGFLYHRLTSGGKGRVDPGLEDYLQEKRDLHGRDRVWSYSARSFVGGGLVRRDWLWFWLAFVIAGPVWLAVGIALIVNKREEEGLAWGSAGFWLTILGGVGAAVVSSSARGYVKKQKKGRRLSSLVICPDGLALAQGDTVGQLRWDEIRDIRLGGNQIKIKVEGAEIVLNDVYDRPLPLIRQLLGYYYEGGHEADRPAWSFDAGRLRDDADRFTSDRAGYRG